LIGEAAVSSLHLLFTHFDHHISPFTISAQIAIFVIRLLEAVLPVV
jgi:hypothetical protein